MVVGLDTTQSAGNLSRRQRKQTTEDDDEDDEGAEEGAEEGEGATGMSDGCGNEIWMPCTPTVQSR